MWLRVAEKWETAEKELQHDANTQNSPVDKAKQKRMMPVTSYLDSAKVRIDPRISPHRPTVS